MLRNYLLIAFRNLRKHKAFSVINMAGVAIGLACFLLIALYVQDELWYDRYNAHADRTYRVTRTFLSSEGTVSLRLAQAAPPFGPLIKQDFPEVEQVVRTLASGGLIRYGEHSFNEEDLYFAEADLFKVFSFDLLSGNPDLALVNPFSILFSRPMAEKYFGKEDPVGKTVRLNNQFDLTVTGVYESLPAQAHFHPSFLLSFSTLNDNRVYGAEGIRSNWSNNSFNTYMLLRPGRAGAPASPQRIEAGFPAFQNKHVPPEEGRQAATWSVLNLQKLTDIHLRSHADSEVEPTGDITYIYLFSAIGLFILLIACINFMNLSTAKASVRLKEVGVKKAIGASRGTLISQYMGESMFMAFLSLLVAILLVVLLLPTFNEITQKHLSLTIDFKLFLAFFAITLLTGIIAGSYPSLYLSSFNPVTVLKGGTLSRKLTNSVGEVWIRQGLVVFQFALSVILIVSVQVVYRQISYVQSKNVGFKKDNVIYFSKEGKIAENTEAFLAEVKKIPGVLNASGMEKSIIGSSGGTVGLDWKGKNPKESIRFINITVDYDAIETLGMHMKDGRAFAKKFGADSTNIIFNEAAIKAMGLKNPVGQIVQLWGQNRQIVGVVSDFNFESLHDEIKPVFLKLKPSETMTLMASIDAGKQPETIAKLHQVYQEFNPGYSLEYKFLDEAFQAQYVSEQRVSILSRYFAGLAILISCLGLFGLAAFTAERRNKEIGIRKVLGASVLGIITLLSKDFIKLVIIAIAIALPVSYYFMHKWLQGFAYRIDIQWWTFTSVAILVTVIALATVSFQSVKAALMNPVKSLRSE